MKSFSASLPRRIVFRRRSISDLPSYLRSLDLRGKAMLVTGRRFARESGYLDKITSLLRSDGFEVIVFDRIEPNPLVETVEAGGELARGERVDFVIGFGGGSAMDAAKGIAILASQGGRLEDYFYPADVGASVLPIVAIPTTCGTGSEVTRYAIFSRGFKKFIVVSERIVPILSILDAEVLDHLPRSVAAHTAIDALSHAIEAYYHANSSELSDNFAKEALRLILENFKRGIDGDPEARERLFYASMLAGLAINMAGTVVVHGLGYYLTQRFGIPHGLANSLFLNQFIEYAARSIPEKTSSLVELVGLRDRDEAVGRLIDILNDLRSYAGLPMKLSEVGVSSDELEVIVGEGMSYRRNLEGCIKPPSRDDLERMVVDAF